MSCLKIDNIPDADTHRQDDNLNTRVDSFLSQCAFSAKPTVFVVVRLSPVPQRKHAKTAADSQCDGVLCAVWITG